MGLFLFGINPATIDLICFGLIGLFGCNVQILYFVNQLSGWKIQVCVSQLFLLVDRGLCSL